MKTLIITLFLLLPLVSIADVPCHVAKNQQHDSILKLEHQLTIAQSEPYNQGFQAGYKAGTLTAWTPEKVTELMLITVGCIAFLGLAATIYNTSKP